MSTSLIELTLSGIQGCLTSIAAPENIRDVTTEQQERLNAIYEELLDLQQEIACGPRATHVPLQPTRPIYTKRKR